MSEQILTNKPVTASCLWVKRRRGNLFILLKCLVLINEIVMPTPFLSLFFFYLFKISLFFSYCFIIKGNSSNKERGREERGHVKQYGGEKHCLSDHWTIQTCKYQNGSYWWGRWWNCVRCSREIPWLMMKPHMTDCIGYSCWSLHPSCQTVLCKLLISDWPVSILNKYINMRTHQWPPVRFRSKMWK